MPNKKVLAKKKEYVSELKQKISESPSAVLVDYKGISVAQDTALRKELREAGVEYRVAKNTLVHLAIQGTPYTDLDKALFGTTAIALSKEDALAPARILCKYAEKSKGAFTVKSGFIEGKVYSAEEISVLSKLPGREGLLSMLLSAITGNIRGLAVALNAIAEKKEGEAIA